MNTDLIFELLDIVIGMAQGLTDNTMQGDAQAAHTLLEIADRAAQAYHDHTGEPITLGNVPFEPAL